MSADYVCQIFSLGVCLKNSPHQSCCILLDTTSKFALFSASDLKVEKLIRKHENWSM